MQKKKIAVFHTGGTIAMKKDECGGLDLQGDNPLADNALSSVELVEEMIFGVSSPQMTEHTMVTLANAIKRKLASDRFDGVVVTHGTDTMEETAYFLDITTPNDVPIVVTGSMRSTGQLGSDAVYNYQCAMMVAISEGARGLGTLVTFNEEIHAARNVTKFYPTNLAGFQSPGFGPVGFIAGADVVFGRTLPAQTRYDVTSITKNVMLIRTYAGITSTVFDGLEALAEKQGKYPIDGLVIEALGAGNVPAWIVESLQRVERRGVPIVLATRCVDGVVQGLYDYSGGGMRLKKDDVKSIIFSNGLSGQKARLKLAVLLEKTTDPKEIEAQFAL